MAILMSLNIQTKNRNKSGFELVCAVLYLFFKKQTIYSFLVPLKKLNHYIAEILVGFRKCLKVSVLKSILVIQHLLTIVRRILRVLVCTLPRTHGNSLPFPGLFAVRPRKKIGLLQYHLH